jgi:hypothetical protein
MTSPHGQCLLLLVCLIKKLTTAPNLGAKVESLNFPKGEVVGGRSNYAYLLEWDELYAPAAVNEMLNAGLVVKVATNTFECRQQEQIKNLITEQFLFLLINKRIMLKP